MSNIFGTKLDPYAEIKTMMAMKGKKQRVKVGHVPSMINQNEDLYVDISNMGQNDVIFPSSIKLLFYLELTGTNTKRTIVSNIGKSLVQNLRITLKDNEVQNISAYRVLATYKDLWLPKFDRENNLILEGINPNDGTIRALQVKATDHVGTDEEKAIVAAYGSTFCIPIGKMFELTRDLPFYQPGLHDRLQFVIHFASYGDVIKDAGTPAVGSTAAKPADSAYKITNIALEFDKVNNEALASAMMSRYSRLALPYERVLRSKVVTIKKADTSYNLQIDTPAKSLKGVLLLFVDPGKVKAYSGANEVFYNPKIEKISITVEGEPNELYTHAMLPKDHLEQIVNLFGSHDSKVIGQFFTERYALFVDFRASPDHSLHGSGRPLQRVSDGITLHMTKKADGTTGDIKCYVFLLQDAQLNILDGCFHSVEY
ncbi:uncharacterized protein LOC130648967 [Hydractinia symbiolongicarpus]|uniref:uncharacterized protein LOC130648967 n=1 Tax=Hydractinia symbiolongicarpus TaxID=13093 RepID=UPI00254ACCEE|nr:uncharacterized protein LOC130648967 [Hydractinia symbiolongicarpus]